jgi:hypothetical protein
MNRGGTGVMVEIDEGARGRLVSVLVHDDQSAPRYRSGDRLLCEPTATAEPGEDVAVIEKDGAVRVGCLMALDQQAITIELGRALVPIPRSKVNAIWPVRLMAPGRKPLAAASSVH